MKEWAKGRFLENCTRWRKLTDGHGDSMTESAHWGRFCENRSGLSLIGDKAVDCWTKVAEIINQVFHFAHFTLPNGFLT